MKNTDNNLIYEAYETHGDKACEPAIKKTQLNTRNKAKAALDNEVAYTHPDAARKIGQVA